MAPVKSGEDHSGVKSPEGCPMKQKQQKENGQGLRTNRSNSFSERVWIKPDLPSKCTWKPGTTETDPHSHVEM